MKIIEVKDLSIIYNLQSERIETFKEYFVKFFKRQLKKKKFCALKNISFDIDKSESLAIIGRNGAGKSTLVKLIAGILPPTTGNININGTATLLSLGAGFDSNMTARENVFLNGAMLGYSRKEMKKRYDSIVEFSELAEFMNVPIKNFSSGMVSRLAFAIATDINADILIADEALSVGDISFRSKCEQRIKAIHDAGTTFILVSHSMEQVKKLCDKAIWLEKGEMKMFGDSKTVTDAYIEYSKKEEKQRIEAEKLKEQQKAGATSVATPVKVEKVEKVEAAKPAVAEKKVEPAKPVVAEKKVEPAKPVVAETVPSEVKTGE